MVSLADRIKNVHPNARTKVRDTAQYVTDGLSEFYITKDNLGYYKIIRYKGGLLPTYCQGSFTSLFKAHERLVGHLQRTNKFKRAIWPKEPYVDYGEG